MQTEITYLWQDLRIQSLLHVFTCTRVWRHDLVANWKLG